MFTVKSGSRCANRKFIIDMTGKGGGGYLIEIEKMDFLKNFQNIWNISEKNINDKYLISKDSRLFKAGIIAN